MIKHNVILIAAILLISHSKALACSIAGYPVEEDFKRSQLVTLSRPLAVSYLPKGSDDPGYTGSFRQTILWEVLVSWKGNVKAGDRFTTRRTYSSRIACTSYFPVYSMEAHLLFARGSEPYADFDHKDLKHPMSYYFKFLASKGAN